MQLATMIVLLAAGLAMADAAGSARCVECLAYHVTCSMCWNIFRVSNLQCKCNLLHGL